MILEGERHGVEELCVKRVLEVPDPAVSRREVVSSSSSSQLRFGPGGKAGALVEAGCGGGGNLETEQPRGPEVLVQAVPAIAPACC